ncbi:1-phosphofructokinase [Deinobacterium chartae]|uniref:1-phosphofructokinase n=1 Tax=Deinobacterium chartae TaxID=521158 RepID=A0A841I0L4_9DEIO|nr:1-phosphofructokinase [Deinobacterium chartae]MBB6099207.1 1-phosphofructokinase [Deinobacterium chartae]
MRVATLTLNPALDLTVHLSGLQPGEVNTATSARSDAGGKGVNVASFLADWGLQVTATGLLGQANARPFEELLASKGIADAFVRVTGENRVGVKLVDDRSQQTTDINLPGLEVDAASLEALRARVRELAPRHDTFVLAGSLPRGVAASTYAELIRELRAHGANAVLDSSGRALSEALHAAPGIIKPNIHELEALLGRRLEDEAAVLAAAHDLLRGGPELVIVSMGERGALFVTADQALRAVPPRVQVISTVGAGDAMVAGTVAARAAGLDLEGTARLATAFSVGAITRPGAHLPPRDELESIRQNVRVSAADAWAR